MKKTSPFLNIKKAQSWRLGFLHDSEKRVKEVFLKEVINAIMILTKVNRDN